MYTQKQSTRSSSLRVLQHRRSTILHVKPLVISDYSNIPWRPDRMVDQGPASPQDREGDVVPGR